jgi:hypothetical protein
MLTVAADPDEPLVTSGYPLAVELGPIDTDASVDFVVLNLELVQEGWAWWYRKYAPKKKELTPAEAVFGASQTDSPLKGVSPCRCRRRARTLPSAFPR